MSYKKISIDSLSANALSYAVFSQEGKARGLELRDGEIHYTDFQLAALPGETGLFSPATSYEQGMPILNDAGISFRKNKGLWYAMTESDAGTCKNVSWNETTYHGGERYGKLSYEVKPRVQVFKDNSMLVAGFRAYVAARVVGTLNVPTAFI